MKQFLNKVLFSISIRLYLAIHHDDVQDIVLREMHLRSLRINIIVLHVLQNIGESLRIMNDIFTNYKPF